MLTWRSHPRWPSPGHQPVSLSQAIAVALDRRWGVLRMLATTPLGPIGLFAGKLGAIAIVALIQAAVLAIVGAFLGLGFTVGVLLPGLAFMVLGLAAFLGLGLLIGGTLKPEAVLALANTLWIVMAGLGAIIIPASEYPSWWGAIVEFTPPPAPLVRDFATSVRANPLLNTYLFWEDGQWAGAYLLPPASAGTRSRKACTSTEPPATLRSRTSSHRSAS